MSRTALRVVSTSLLLAGAAACGVVSSVRPRASTTTGPGARPGQAAPPGVTGAGRTPAGGERTRSTRGAQRMDEQLICRTGGVPRGWIAVAYVSAPDQCPTRTGADSVATTTATAALITSYADRPTGAMLDVCADQPIPPGWQTLSHESVEDASRCPGASRDGRPTAKRIRRVR